MFSFLLGLGRDFSASSCGKLRPKSVWNKCWKADWFWFARGRRGKAYFLVTARNRKYRVFLEDRERGKRCVMLKQAKVGSKKLRDLSCVDKPLPGGAQGCALLQLRWVPTHPPLGKYVGRGVFYQLILLDIVWSAIGRSFINWGVLFTLVLFSCAGPI